jgi:hypothetical protein
MKRPELFPPPVRKAVVPFRSATDSGQALPPARCRSFARAIIRADCYNGRLPTGLPESDELADPDAAARFAAQRAFIAADNSARRSAEILGLARFFAFDFVDAAETAALFFAWDLCFLASALVSFRRSLASFLVSFSIRSTRRRIFLFKFFAFTVI